MQPFIKKIVSFLHDKSRRYILYYVAVAAIMFYFMRPDTSISMTVRLAMLGLIIAPVIVHINLLPVVLLLFVGIDAASFVHVLPETDWYYVVIVLAFYILYRNKSSLLLKELLVFAYFFFSAAFFGDIRECFDWMFVAMVLCDMIKEKRDLRMLFHGYLLMTMFLGVLFLVYHNDFTQQETIVSQMGNTEEVVERSGWTNYNVFGLYIASGGVLAVSFLTGALKFPNSKFSLAASIITAVLAVVVLAMNASRGASISFIAPALFLFLVSNTKLRIKLLFLVVAGGVVYWLFTQNLFEALLTRMESESFDTAGGRSEIWQAKLYQFLYFFTPNQRLLGIGQSKCLSLGVYYSTHNDYLTALIAYGIIGFGLFTYFVIVHPIVKAGKKKLLTVVGLLLYLVIEGFVAEPFFRGYFVAIMFYFFVLKYAMLNDDSEENKPSSVQPTMKTT